jgi:hypothetical protein
MKKPQKFLSILTTCLGGCVKEGQFNEKYPAQKV